MADADTFTPIDLKAPGYAQPPLETFVTELCTKLDVFRNKRVAFYDQLRRGNSKWVHGSRTGLAWLVAIAFVLTCLAAAFRLQPKLDVAGLGDDTLLGGVLLLYAMMGAIATYERGTDRTSSYFRQIGIVISIRDLWTRLQFEMVKELMTAKNAGAIDPAADASCRQRLLALAQAFVSDVDKAALGELTEWRNEVLQSLSELEAASKKGTEDITARLQEALRAAEKTAQDARSAAKAAEDAARPGGINLTLAGDFDGEAVVSIDDKEAARSTGKVIALAEVKSGLRKVAVQATKAQRQLMASVIVDVKPVLQELKITLT